VKAFFDTNVLIDVLAERRPFYADSAAVQTLAEDARLEGLVSAVSFTNVFYILRKLSDAQKARSALALLRDAFTIVACDGRILAQAMSSAIKDFEDAVQYHSAVQGGADCMLSRNPTDFAGLGGFPVLTPAEFLAAHQFP
jgi:predicted nucleic acid-binding protein